MITTDELMPAAGKRPPLEDARERPKRGPRPPSRATRRGAESARPTVLEFMADPRVFGDLFSDPSWDRWRTVAAAIYGLPLDAADAAFFASVTGRAYDTPAGGWREVVVITGARSGKSSIASVVAAYEAAHPVSRPKMGDAYALLVCQDQRSALRTLLDYARTAFAQPSMKKLVETDLNDVLTLSTGVRLAAYPCRPAALRGLTAVATIADEFAFFTGTEGKATRSTSRCSGSCGRGSPRPAGAS